MSHMKGHDHHCSTRERHNSALQSHVTFFDTDNDGIIWPSDTFTGLRDLGFGILFCLLAVPLIHGSLSWITFGTILPDPYFRLKVLNMQRAKHGSDSSVYTPSGEFDEARFDSVFDMYSSEPHTHMTFYELVRMVRANRDAFDFVFGWGAATGEWIATYLLIWPEDGKLKKEDLRAVYDGSLFYKVSGRPMKTD